MKTSTVAFSLVTAIALGFTLQARADVCENGQEHYTELKSEYQNCIRTAAGKFKEQNPLCTQIKEKMTIAKGQIKDCQMAQAVNKALAANSKEGGVKAQYDWQKEQ